MKPGVYIERLAKKEDHPMPGQYVVLEKIEVDMCISMFLCDGHKIRITHENDHIEISTPTGVLNVRPSQMNAIQLGVVKIGETPKGTSDASL